MSLEFVMSGSDIVLDFSTDNFSIRGKVTVEHGNGVGVRPTKEDWLKIMSERTLLWISGDLAYLSIDEDMIGFRTNSDATALQFSYTHPLTKEIKAVLMNMCK